MFLSLLGILAVQLGFAQQKTIKETITDDTGLPLPGATVLIENPTRGVSTDFDGNFSITASVNEILIVSNIGYADQRVPINENDVYNITMFVDNELEGSSYYWYYR